MNILFVCFWFFFYPGSFAKLDTEWWRHTIIYEVIPYSFKDSDGDGIGDFKGMTSTLDHLDGLGIGAVHMTPHYPTTAVDMGYDITDYYKVEPSLGTMADFDELIREMNKRNMKLLIDLVINHSSYKHEWFQKSIDRVDPYTDYYVWKNSKGFDEETQKEIPPNRWVSYFNDEPGACWTWNEKRKQFYFHHYLKEQPDLNLWNEDLKKELKKIIEFWLNKGVAGFRLDATPDYFEDKELRDDDVMLREFNQPETIEFIHEFRGYLDEYNKKHGGFERIFIAEAHTEDNILLQYYGTTDYPVTHFPYTFVLEYIYNPVSAFYLKYSIDRLMEKIPKGAVLAWMTQDHDGIRVGSRLSPEYADLFTILSMLLPGAVGVYYGQEIAMLNGFITDGQIRDYSGYGSRDPTRLAMQWDDTMNAGFSTSLTPYLPACSDYYERNVKNQKSQPISHYALFKDLSNLRKTKIFKHGKYESYELSKYDYAMKRSYEGDVLAVVINLGTSSARINLTQIVPNHSRRITVVAASINSGYSKGFRVTGEIHQFYMRPLSSVVLKTREPTKSQSMMSALVDSVLEMWSC